MDGKSPASILDKREFDVESIAAKQHAKKVTEAGTTESSRRWLNAKRQTSPVIYEDTARKKPMVSYVAAEFKNWGLTVSNTPAYTFVPTSVQGLQNLVLWAKANNKRVRASGYRHSWTPLFSQDNEILVSMLHVAVAESVPDPMELLPVDPTIASNEFKTIEVGDVSPSDPSKRLVRVGAAVTNEQLRRWSIRGGAWTLPYNTVIVGVTIGGTNAPICHGAGIKHATLSDIVRKIEYIDVNGVHRAIDDPAELKAAAGSFGLLGIITHVTFEMDKMTYAHFKPLKQDVNLVIPPPTGFKVPVAIRKSYTPAQLEAARLDFINKAENSFYAEYFWFPYQQEAIANCWNNTDDASSVYDYPTYPDVFFQWVQGWLGGVINDSALFRALPGYWQAEILGALEHFSMPPQLGVVGADVKTYLPDALHFRRGVNNMRVRDMELQIPIPPRADDPTKPDWEVVQKAWWDAIDAVYKDPTAAMRIALEMRIMAGSDMIMAPQKGNSFGTASIEVLTSMPAVADGSWVPFQQKVADRWMSYQANGELLKTRPHWAKEWDGLTVRGQPWRQFLKEVSYKDEIPQFMSVLQGIGAKQNFTLADLKSRFSNPLLDEVFFD
ncbi:hypothetical protein FN846DRAFT_900289 [Sphaerosporella brunnea]|uniref:FAD-binding PCMH-type domain-containing protein n=1 Tax=Sphaerosporella brunnea TaxID=1250544 RepID=A0A5J5EL51_9PEZI|nr:hypothetical protein FN846DRAFT_900289 [Sphaerosporella brunnea]